MKMKVSVFDKIGKEVETFEFKLSEDIREDIFKKAIIAENSLFRQSYGATPLAGKKASINVSKRRQTFRSTYGKSISRTPRKTMWRRGMQLRFVGAFAANTVGGRRAHPPKGNKSFLKDINNKEWLKALKIGMTASMNNKLVAENGQKVPSTYPFILDNSLENVTKTSEFREILVKLGFDDELERTAIRKVRAGKGTMRNRTYKVKRGPLVVVSSTEVPLMKAARNFRGFEVITPDLLMVSDFGMSYKPGRAVIFTKLALEGFKEVLE
jgi:large subunit ribosomal protein L4e